MAILGKRNQLHVVREAPPGLYLDGGALGEILLPRRYVPQGLRPLAPVAVFVYRDSEDRLVATTETPCAEVGEFALLRVVSVNDRVGAFLDWGLAKDLLLPFREQEKPVRVGQQVVVYIYIDSKSERIVATTRFQAHLSSGTPPFRNGQPVEILITGAGPLGFHAIVEQRYRGLLYRDQTPLPLPIGQRLQAFVRNLRPDDQIDLSLDATGYRRVGPLTAQIVAALQAQGGTLPFDDASSPEAIREKFHVSKKAFKQALGKLYKLRRIRFTSPGIQLLDNSEWTPGDPERVRNVPPPPS